MISRCAWCGRQQGLKEPLDDGQVTDGICLPCARRILSEKGTQLDIPEPRPETRWSPSYAEATGKVESSG